MLPVDFSAGYRCRQVKAAKVPFDEGGASSVQSICEHVFVSSKGSPYPRFQRALKTGNLAVIRNAAAELPRVDLVDALAVCVAIRDAEPERFDRATLRWLARYCSEQAYTAHDVRAAAAAFALMPDDPVSALAALRGLTTRR